MQIALYLNNYPHVKTYLNKMAQVGMTQTDPMFVIESGSCVGSGKTDGLRLSVCSLKSKLAAGFGLVALHEHKYRDAALRFMECHADIGSTFNEVGNGSWIKGS